MAPLDNFTLIGLPYVALVVFLVGTISRYKMTKFSYSSLSSQFLEGRQLFWGTMPFHWGILFLFLGHLVAFLVPRGLLAFNSHPVRLLIIE
ncbi:MAG: respiratory nitrate reductase subunit gamma, partial [Candidatus Krumholzibacteria bacterium]|nr:respiratory nitrate reductase subunit gamma [Candidatus Krumholzibacteria bacterium]